MNRVTVLVTIDEESEWNATDAGTFRGCGYASFAGTEYEDGNAIAEYDVEVYGDDDIKTIENRLNDDGSVISFEIS